MRNTLRLAVAFGVIAAFSLVIGSTSVKASPPPGLNVTTSNATNVSQTTATLNGSVSYIDGTPTIVERGFDYGVTTDYGSSVVAGGDPVVGDFNASISGLSCGTTYHARAYSTYMPLIGYSKPRFLLAFLFTVAYASPGNIKATDSDVTFTTSSCANNSGSHGFSGSQCYNFVDKKFGGCFVSMRSSVSVAASSTVLASTPVAASSTASDATSTPEQFGRNLYRGLSGTDVTALQDFLIHDQSLVSPPAIALKQAGATEYFGPSTQGALIEYQKLKAILPSIGFFGPITRNMILTDMGML
jgi:hypothetical protein